MTETKWYNPFEDTNNHAYPFVASKVNLSDSDEWDLRSGKQLLHWKKKVTFRTDKQNNDGTPDEALQHCVVSLPVFSEPLRQALESDGITGIQYLPVQVRRPSRELIPGYSIANITNLLPALDADKSMLMRYGVDDEFDRSGKISSIMKSVLNKSVLDGYDIFRLEEYPLAYSVSARFRNIFVCNRFTGYSFKEVLLS